MLNNSLSRKILLALFFVASSGISYYFGLNELRNTPDQSSQKAVSIFTPAPQDNFKDSQQISKDIKKITDDGYIIKSHIFYSENLNLLFTGIIDGITYNNKDKSFIDDQNLIKIFEVPNGKTELDVVKGLIVSEGKNLDNCNITQSNAPNGDDKEIFVVSKNEPKPDNDLFILYNSLVASTTRKEYESFFANPGEDVFEKVILAKRLISCGTYNAGYGYKGVSDSRFIFSKNNSRNVIFFVRDTSGGGGRGEIFNITASAYSSN